MKLKLISRNSKMKKLKTEKELNADILKISIEIGTKYQELSVNLAEIPETIPNLPSPKINRETLSEYYQSLKIMEEDYIKNNYKTFDNQ